VPGAAYKKGDDFDRKYEVYGVLGAGGFGIVYLVYSRELKAALALKTFRDEYLADAQTRERFRTEASVWVDLERHPYLVRAYFVDEIASRLFIGMEHIAPDEHGLNSLEGYLRQRPPDLTQSLRWAIQFCHGMEYAYLRGIRCHRDIKPANIMIGSDKAVKITDFGLAGALGMSKAVSEIRLNIQEERVGLSGQTMEGTGFGTPPYMPPEQFTDAASCDERSDIYSFGVVLFQMASGGRLPFLAPKPTDDSEAEKARFWGEMHRLHSQAPMPKLNSPLTAVIQRCIEKEPGKRYQCFKELRDDLEPLHKRQTGETVRPPESQELGAWEWSNKGMSLRNLCRCEEAIRCYDKALELDLRFAAAWSNKGVSLDSLGRYEEAIRCFDKVLELDPRYVLAWNNKGGSLYNLGRVEQALRCYDKVLEIDPRDATAWTNKGSSLGALGRCEDAVRCYDKALELDPRYVLAWNNKGASLASLARYEEAIRCFDKALELDPLAARAWGNRGNSLLSSGRCEEAIRCYDKALELDPRDATAWANRGNSLDALGRCKDAIRCYDKALELDPRNAAVWNNKGLCLSYLGFDDDPGYEEAIRCFDKALEIDPRYTDGWRNKGESLGCLGRYEEAIRGYDKALELDQQDAESWFGKGLAQEELGRRLDAVRSFKRCIAVAQARDAAVAEDAQQRIRELEGK
jgi:tetratricopeptide (TPR) repeat protein/tRNA A-37 threonylcarbamoyl transferase component Bud32